MYVNEGGRGRRGALNVNKSAPHYRSLEMDGWMTCHFIFFSTFSTVFQPYQNNGRVIIICFVQITSFTVEKISLKWGSNSRRLDQLGIGGPRLFSEKSTSNYQTEHRLPQKLVICYFSI